MARTFQLGQLVRLLGTEFIGHVVEIRSNTLRVRSRTTGDVIEWPHGDWLD